ncbi:hypothetical protein N9F70_01320, partial [bacterium]|nr:hypothetical protein [bacterium]
KIGQSLKEVRTALNSGDPPGESRFGEEATHRESVFDENLNAKPLLQERQPPFPRSWVWPERPCKTIPEKANS